MRPPPAGSEIAPISGGSGGRSTDDRQVKHLFARLRGWVLWFLDAIGLYRDTRMDQEAHLARFRLHHTEFRRLLNANNNFLTVIGGLEDLRQGDRAFDHAWVRAQALRANVDVYQMVSSLNAISDNRYPALAPRLEEIAAELGRRLEGGLQGTKIPLVLDLAQVRAQDAWLAGGKMANLGEIRNGVGMPTPDGFAVTVESYHRVVRATGISAAALLPEPEDPEPIPASLPAEVEEALTEAYDRLAASLGRSPLLAVRSSALGEDSHLSFAGQFQTVLQVPRSGLREAYLNVLRSLYSPKAIHYRRLHRISDASMAMAVGCIEMVDAAVAGVAYSVDPRVGNTGRLLIHAVRGLGVSLVDGQASPEIIEVERGHTPHVAARTPSSQEVAVRGCESGGVREEGIPVQAGQVQCLSDAEASELAGLVLRLEAHFGIPQDVEWAMDHNRRFWLLQSRPLRVFVQERATEPPLEDRRVLLSGGEAACPGVGIGPVRHASENDDLESFPDGAVLVAPRSSPCFVQVMAKARAIVTDLGSATGHMAALAREFRVPALVNTRHATSILKPGQVVTVDVRGRRVYDGAVAELRSQEESFAQVAEKQDLMRDTPVFRLLESVAELLIPLHLANPREPAFAPEHCRTLHDVARFAHEKSYEEMFLMGGRLGDMRDAGVRLDVFLPIDLFIFDLGGGIEAPAGLRRVKPAQVRSVPLSALLAGMLDKRIPRFGARPMDLRGFIGIMMRHALESPEQARTFRDPCYALVSDRYLNYTARVGYHFGVVDTYCGLTPNKNYISVLFRGGAADHTRRGRRARAIAGVLQHHGFAIAVEGDAVHARLSKRDQPETAAHLEMIGRMFQFFRQMDAAMTSEESVRGFQQAFLEEDYDLSRWKQARYGDGKS